MRGLDLKKRIYVSILLSFLAGILYVNLAAKEVCETNEMFNTYILKQYQSMEINIGSYFLYILRVRMFSFGLITALMFTRFRKAAAWASICWTCFLGGFLMTMGVLCMGIKGSLFCLLGGFPHVVLYLIASVVVLWYGLIYPRGHWDIQKTIFITGMMLTGIFLEAYINPVIMKVFISVL
ncbi:MAG: stage II sporulation protein M [Schaedlerella sp.]|nr:stage II sporulation protein M [Schaedlerella sp.]